MQTLLKTIPHTLRYRHVAGEWLADHNVIRQLRYYNRPPTCATRGVEICRQ